MSNAAQRLLAYFGDDFTGSTDALEFLSRAGAKTALFIEPPSPEQLGHYPNLQAIGVAGMTRSLAPDAMEAVLRPAFTALKALDVRHVHYKVCSTFDSSPTIGSIGRAIDVGADVFADAPFVPVLVGAPALGRYCVFGNLFARMGIGSDGSIFRLDRHPSASRHPTTPADEADLLEHLARQTNKRIDLFDILQISQPLPEAHKALEKRLRESAPEIVFFDLLEAVQQVRIGRLLDGFASLEAPLFSVGSSGIEMALGDHWCASGMLGPASSWPDPGPTAPLLVLTGSRSPVTSRQIERAVADGFAEVALDTAGLVRQGDQAIAQALETTGALLDAKRHVIVHTSRGDGDPRIATTAEAFALGGFSPEDARGQTGRLFGEALGRIAREAVARHGVRRLLIAGGDTASFAARALGIEAVEMLAPLAPGAPLCRASALGSPADGLEINFKGGQVGGDDYFAAVARGKLRA